jgi:hypothetical protein
MGKKATVKTQVTLVGAAKDLVLSEQKKYRSKKQIRGKNKLINQLLCELAGLRQIKPSQTLHTANGLS